MARQPAISPSPSPEPATKKPGPKWFTPTGMIAAGAVLLLAGGVLVTYAMAGPEDKLKVVDGPAVPVALTDATPSAEPTTAPPTPTESPTGKASKETRSQPRHTVTVKAEPKVTPTKKVKRKAKKKPIRAAAKTPYLLHNVATGKCLGQLAFNVPVTQELCDSSSKIQLRKTRMDGGNQLYQLVDSSDTNMCADPPGRETNPSGTLLTAVPCNPPTEDNQEWRLKDTGEVSKGRVQYAVVNAASGLCLDILGLAADGSDRPAGLSVTLAGCTDQGYDDRLWTFS